MKPHQISRLALGTVQFGLEYGVANSSGQVGKEEAANILELANSKGIATLDTAIAYGESETVLGQMDTSGFELVTKLPPLPSETTSLLQWMEDHLNQSLSRLKKTSVDALLLHNAGDISGRKGREIYEVLLSVKASGKVKKIGWSVYSPADLDRLDKGMQADLVQLPFNILDQRMLNSGWLDKLKDAGTEIHARSAFLQGLLLMPPDKRPVYFDQWPEIWAQWDGFLSNSQISPLAACLGFSLSVGQIDRVVIGVDSSRQLDEILSLDLPENPPQITLPEVMPEALINPSLWNIA